MHVSFRAPVAAPVVEAEECEEYEVVVEDTAWHQTEIKQAAELVRLPAVEKKPSTTRHRFFRALARAAVFFAQKLIAIANRAADSDQPRLQLKAKR